MAVNAYLVIDGRPGPSTSKQDAIDILSFSFGASNTAVIGAGSSGGEARAGRANLGDVTIMKVLDKTSPLLFDDCVTGNYLKKVDIIYDKPMGDNQEDYFKIHMEDASDHIHPAFRFEREPCGIDQLRFQQDQGQLQPRRGWRAEGLHRQGLRRTQAQAVVSRGRAGIRCQ